MLLAVLAVLAPVSVKTVQVSLIESHTNLSVTAQEAAPNAFLVASLPIPYRSQAPLEIRAVTRPTNKVARLSILDESGDRLVRVEFAPLAAGEALELDLVTTLMSSSAPPDDGQNVRLATPADLPEEIRPYLGVQPGIESADERVRKIASEVSGKDLAHAADDVLRWLGKNISAGGGPQGALEVLERGSSACTGFANLGAAIFVAARIPARVLPCILVGVEQQEHYIVEVWTKELGWSKVETTLKRFPLDDSLHVILRQARPDSPRGPGHVPILHPRGTGVDAAFRYDEKRCFQGAKRLGAFDLDEKDEARIRETAKAGFDALTRKAAQGPSVELAPAGKLGTRLGSRARALLEMSQRKP
ncbi:MAG: transglutaminase family protein [Planctomycetes bacterium]|nr:transglutaminase family protein [Planctomycetota bacterium]